MKDGGPAFPRVLSVFRRYNPPGPGHASVTCGSCKKAIAVGQEYFVAEVQTSASVDDDDVVQVKVCWACGVSHKKAIRHVQPKELDARVLLAESERLNDGKT